jgi:hypothetical protein
MIDLTNAHTWTKDVATAINHEGGGGGHHPSFTWASQNVAVAATLLVTLLAPSTDGVDKVYQQLKDILSITTTQ